MDLFKWIIMIYIGSLFLVILVYVYLYIFYRARYMVMWILSWFLHILKLAFFDLAGVTQISSTSLILTYQLISMCSGMLLVWGTHDFIGKSMKKWWGFAAVMTTVVSDIAIIFNWSLIIKALPSAWMIGIILIWTGVIFIRHSQVQSSAIYVTGGAFILLGIHNLDYPFLLNSPVILAWAFIFGVVLRIIVALGTLIVYFEQIKRELINKEKYYRLITENAVDIIYRYRFTPEPAFEYVSPAVSDITGYTPAEYYADPELELQIVHQDDRKSLMHFRNPSSLSEKPIEFRLIRKDGAQIWTEQRGVPIYNEAGKIVAFEGIVRDITERRRLEQDMFRLDGLHAVGQMAANIAHEIRNPMTTVRGYLQLFGDKKEFSIYKEEFELLLAELDRTNSIITEYLSLSKEKVPDFKSCQLNKIIKAIFPLIQADANASSKCINLDLAKIPELYLDEKEIRQLLLNLVRNGLEAMDAGGTLIIQTMLDEDIVVLSVTDQGNGIPPEILEKIGTPFMTTKEQGTGLGLAVCYSIADRHQANIEIATGLHGTTFHIRFPLFNTK